MVSFGRFIFNITGVMSNRGLIKNSRAIAKAMGERHIQTGETVKVADVQQIVSQTIGKKAAKKVQFVDEETITDIVVNKSKIATREEFEKSLEFGDAIQITDRYSTKSNIFIKEGEDPYHEVTGLIAHELQHALRHSFGKSSILQRILGKFPAGREHIDKKITKLIQLDVQSKYEELYREIFENVKNKKTLSTDSLRKLLYSKKIITDGEHKNNLCILKALRKMNQDESYSYTIQAETSKACGQEIPASIYTHLANEFDIVAQACKQEAKELKINRMRKLFGLKPRTAKPQNDIIQNIKKTTLDLKINIANNENPGNRVVNS